MNLIKKTIGVILLFVSLLFCTNVFSDFGGDMDNSKQLHTFLEKHAEHLDYPYSFKVHKQDNFYNVIIKYQNKELIKKVPQVYVDELFEKHDKNSEKAILQILFIPGKE